MKITRPKTEKWHNFIEGDCGKLIEAYFKKGFWKRYDRKKYFKRLLKFGNDIK